MKIDGARSADCSHRLSLDQRLGTGATAMSRRRHFLDAPLAVKSLHPVLVGPFGALVVMIGL
jgi:hypothetical protein